MQIYLCSICGRDFCWNESTQNAVLRAVCRPVNNTKFIPIMAETPGGWDMVAIAEVKKLMAAKVRHLGVTRMRRPSTPSPSCPSY